MKLQSYEMGVEVDYEQQTAEMKFWQQWLDSHYTISYNDSTSQLIVRNLHEQKENWYVLYRLYEGQQNYTIMNQKKNPTEKTQWESHGKEGERN